MPCKMLMNLYELRKQQKLTQQQVADAVGIGMQAYAYYEKEERNPSPDTLCRLADFFNVSVDELLGRTSSNVFDSAYSETSKMLLLYNELTLEEKNALLAYANGLIKGRKLALHE